MQYTRGKSQLRGLPYHLGLSLLVHFLHTHPNQRIALTVGGMVGFNVLMKMLPLPKIFNQIALFASTLIVLLLVWQILKLATLVQSAEKLKAFANAQRFDKTHGSFSFRSHDKRGRSVTSQYTSPAAPAVLATTSEFAHMGDKAVQEISFRLYAWLDRTRSARDGLTASRSRAPRTQFVIMEASNAAVEEAGSSSDMPPSKLPDKSPDKSPDASGASSPDGSFRPRRSSFTTDDVDTVRASFRPRRLLISGPSATRRRRRAVVATRFI